MIRLILVECFAGLLLLGCGSQDGGVALGALEGSYDITEALDDESEIYLIPTPTCLLRVNGSQVSADCAKSDETSGESESFFVDVAIRETLIAGDLEYTMDRGADDECFDPNRTLTTITGSASKQSGAMVDGIFAPIAGDWSGSLTIQVSYDQEVKAGAPDYCAPQSIELYAYTFGAVVSGGTAQIDWAGEGTMGLLNVVGTKDAISVNGDVVPK